MRISPDGTVNWTPSGVYKVSCECDITYYPLDKQTCEIKVTTAGYTQGEIKLQFKANAVDMSAYVENGEWQIISAGGVSNQQTSSTRGGKKYASLQFSFVLKRRHVFHVLNTLFPVVLMVLLVPLVFKLDLESGDKTGYSLTVLLSYAVYLTVISEHIPSTSVSICYLSKKYCTLCRLLHEMFKAPPSHYAFLFSGIYLAIILILCTLSVPIGILVTHVYHRTDEVSPFLISMLRSSIVKLFFCKRKSRFSNAAKISPNAKNNVESNPDQPSRGETPNPSKNPCDHEQENEITWKEVACLMDNFFFVVFTFIVILITVIISIILGAEYSSY
jgi:hypothetical protein